MKNLSWYLLIILILMSINTSKALFNTDVNPLMGYVSFVANDLPEQKDIVEGCKCEGTGKIFSGDKLYSKPCPCIASGKECKCKKPENQGSVIKSDDCDIIRSMYPQNSPYRKFLPKSKKELWVLSTSGNWCPACTQMKNEFTKMKKTNWTIDESGDFSGEGLYQIRFIDFEKFEGFPSYFFEERDKEGRIIMDGDQPKDNLVVPTLVYWENNKVKLVHKGFLNSFGMLKLFDGKPIVKGTDDVPTK